MSKLLDELKRLFKTPQDAVRALGLDEKLLAMDGKPLGRDESFEKLEHSLAHKKGVHDPKALAAWIGREHGKIKGSNDMSPERFEQLTDLLRQFFAEEAKEPEHAEQGEDDWSPEARAAAAEARKKNATNAAGYHASKRDWHRRQKETGKHGPAATSHHAAFKAAQTVLKNPENDRAHEEAVNRSSRANAHSKGLGVETRNPYGDGKDSALAGDSKRGLNNMPKTTLSAATARGALMNYLAPRLAADAKMPAIMPIVAGITKDNFVAKIPEMVSKLRVAAHGRLAQDADLEDAAEVLEAIARVTGGGEMDAGEDDMMSTEANSGVPPMMEGGEEGGEDDEDGMEEHEPRHVELLRQVRQFCEGKMSPEDCAKLDEMIGEVAAHGAGDDETDEEDDGTGQDEPPPFEGKPEVGGGKEKDDDMKDDKAMDSAAVAKAIDAAVARECARGRAVAVALDAVRPWIGAIDQSKHAFDSAAEVYKHTLEALGKSTKGVHPDAYKPILEAQPKPGSHQAQPRAAMDAAASKSFNERFANAARVGRA